MSAGLQGLVLALTAGYGVYLVYTALVLRWRGVGVGPSPAARRPRRLRAQEFLVQAGLQRVRPVELAAVMAVLFAVAAALGWAMYDGVVVPVAIGMVAAGTPLWSARARRHRRRELAREAWPRLIEEIRLNAVTLGRSIPQALLTVGMRGPEEMRPAFAAAHREWLISTDFERTLDVLRDRLADPTADAVCETLLIAHDVGGTEVDARLKALAADRMQDLQGRKDARAKQAAVRFARLFVLLVPIGMAFVGLSIGEGRAAYASDAGQVFVLVALALIAGCWAWAGQLLRLPEEQRVFLGSGTGERA
ncbi:type II secretion system F family protein [Egicoccus sp. AB-alg6-2]|uniref:type II secretion system F family protein n=1 Tax=Egicoccus sp. AB-alg6-2 TaxID=3242692 RepID=UPI00359DB195